MLRKGTSLMSVSEWSIPIERGGVSTTVGEYSISTVGPGPRAQRHWKWAREAGLETLAKIQAGNTWELSAVPYIPALENVARHAANLKSVNVSGLMLGWTLGGYPSPNLEVACAINALPGEGEPPEDIVEKVLNDVAAKRFGAALAPAVVRAWRACSQAFSEFPYHGGVVYNAPMQFGPSNLLWAEPTGYRATMIGFPYDDLDGWRQVYPPDVFIAQLRKVAEGFERALSELRAALPELTPMELRRELDVIAAPGIHFRSTANQAEFVRLREATRGEQEEAVRAAMVKQIRETLLSEIALSGELYRIQMRDSRIGFEASNQYYYVPGDLLEKIVNCRFLLEEWVPNLTHEV